MPDNPCPVCNGLGNFRQENWFGTMETVSCRDCFGAGQRHATVTISAPARVWRRAAGTAKANGHHALAQRIADACFLADPAEIVRVRVPAAEGSALEFYRRDAEVSIAAWAKAA